MTQGNPEKNSTRRFPYPFWRTLFLCLAAAAVLLDGGCTRRFYRKAADLEVSEVLGDKNKYPEWGIEQWYVYPDPRARFADPTNPDRPPMPPDDPAARDLSPNPQKPPHKAGIARVGGVGYLQLMAEWDRKNRADPGIRTWESYEKKIAPTTEEEKSPSSNEKTRNGAPEPPKPEEAKSESPALEKLDPGTKKKDNQTPGAGKKSETPRPYLLTLEQAVELSLINSRDFQDAREDLYLAALPVTLERFAFTTQFYAMEQAFREWAGTDFPLDQRNRWQLNGQAGFGKLFPTGALLLFQFANRTIINLTNTSPQHVVSTSTIDLDFLQPFLRGGGRAVTLEPLTQVERNLLYEIRDYAHFRKEFFVAIAGGLTFGSGSVSNLGAFAPGSVPLVNPIAFSSRLAITPGGAARAGALSLSAGAPQGFMPIVLVQAQLENERTNLKVLELIEGFFSEYFLADLIEQTNLNAIKQQLFRNRITVLQRQAELGAALDRFKLQLGIPTDVPLELVPGHLEPLLRLVAEYDKKYDFETLLKKRETNFTKAGVKVEEALKKNKIEPGEPLKLRDQLRNLLNSWEELKGTSFQQDLIKRWTSWEQVAQKKGVKKDPVDKILDHLEELGNKRRDLWKEQTKYLIKNQTPPKKTMDEIRSLSEEIVVGRFEKDLRRYEKEPWKLAVSAKDQKEQEKMRFEEVTDQFAALLQRALTAKFDEGWGEDLLVIRKSWPQLPPLCLGGVDLVGVDEETALEVAGRYALANRFDLMNNRAQQVDLWRKIAVAANSLLGTFNVEYHMESNTPAGQARPLAFSGSRTQHQLILNGELPLVRKLERNNYRATLIAYQRQRRALMETEDVVLAGVRNQIRQLRALADNYNTIQRYDLQKEKSQNLDLAYFQLGLAIQAFLGPPLPEGGGPAFPGAAGQPRMGGGRSSDPVSLTQQLQSALNSLLSAKSELYRVWTDFYINRLALYRDLELMPLNSQGVWIDDPTHCPNENPDFRGASPRNEGRPREQGDGPQPNAGTPRGEPPGSGTFPPTPGPAVEPSR